MNYTPRKYKSQKKITTLSAISEMIVNDNLESFIQTMVEIGLFLIELKNHKT
jgi:hypothetical protein